VSACSDAETRYLGQSSCNKSGFGVFAVVHAIVEACTNSDDIFESACQFDADHVVSSVDTEVGSGEPGTDVYSYVGFISGNNCSGRFALGNFTSDVRATQCSDARMSTRKFLFDNLGHA